MKYETLQGQGGTDERGSAMFGESLRFLFEPFVSALKEGRLVVQREVGLAAIQKS